MTKTALHVVVVGSVVALVGCAGSSGSSGGAEAAPVARDAGAFSRDGLSIQRPDGWAFVEPDRTVARDTVVILQGPVLDGETVAPAVEVGQRKLSAQDQRREPAHLLTQLATEIVQYFEAFEMVGSPEDIQLAGKPAARLQMRYTESLPDGHSADRKARFYGVVHEGSLWVIRCVGSADGSHEAEFESILSGLSFGG